MKEATITEDAMTPQAKPPVTPHVGNSPAHALWGGETWTLLWVREARAAAVRLKKENEGKTRMQLVVDPDPSHGKTGPYIYPEQGTLWFTDGNKEIKLTEVTSNRPHLIFSFSIAYRDEEGQKATKDLWLKEGSVNGEELTLYEANPAEEGNVGRPDGSAGYRR